MSFYFYPTVISSPASLTSPPAPESSVPALAVGRCAAVLCDFCSVLFGGQPQFGSLSCTPGSEELLLEEDELPPLPLDELDDEEDEPDGLTDELDLLERSESLDELDDEDDELDGEELLLDELPLETVNTRCLQPPEVPEPYGPLQSPLATVRTVA